MRAFRPCLVPHGGQVMHPIPLVEEVQMGKQLGSNLGAQRKPELGYTPVQLPGELALLRRRRQRAHAADRSRDPERRFRCTSSSEIAAGVIPEMRDAWPIVSGRP